MNTALAIIVGGLIVAFALAVAAYVFLYPYVGRGRNGGAS